MAAAAAFEIADYPGAMGRSTLKSPGFFYYLLRRISVILKNNIMLLTYDPFDFIINCTKLNVYMKDYKISEVPEDER